MLKFEQYLSQFTNTIDVSDFFINLIVTALLTSILRMFYIRYGNSISNRMRFAGNFMPLALTTMLIITIVKSSLALSLGLVGALSIVRFRAAIKDPEELTFLFLVIGTGLATGAEQTLLAIIAVSSILFLLFLDKTFSKKVAFKQEDKLYVNIRTDIKDLNVVSAALTKTFTYVELKRLDTLTNGLDVSFICKADSLAQLQTASSDIKALSEATQLSIIDQPNLID